MKIKNTKQKVLLILAFVLTSMLVGGAIYARDDILGILIPSEDVDDWMEEQLLLKDKETGRILTEEEPIDTFYEESYKRANADQKERLDIIYADKSAGWIGEWKRDVLIVLGDIPADTPRLTVKDAEIYFEEDITYEDIQVLFNEKAGAPDFVGGSGIHREIYYLDDKRSEAIVIMLGGILHVRFDEDGTETIIPIGNQELPPNPGPYVEGAKIVDPMNTSKPTKPPVPPKTN